MSLDFSASVRPARTSLAPGEGRGASWLDGAWLAATLALVALLLFLHLGAAPVTRRAEARVWGVVTTMLRTGDFLVPRLGDDLRLEKPPLYYWLAAAWAHAGGTRSLLWLRAPSALCALALVPVTYGWARRAAGARTALFAAVLTGLHVQLVALGRRGVAEPLLALACTGCFLAFDRLAFERRPGSLALFAGCLALAVLAKATAALLVVGLPIAVFLASRGELRRVGARAALAVGAALAIGLSWYVVLALREPAACSQFLQALFLPVAGSGAESTAAVHRGAPWQTSAFLLQRGWPGIALLPAGVLAARRTRLWRTQPRVRFAATVFLVVFAVFSLLPQKQAHYVLPVMPALWIVLADSVQRVVAPRTSRRALACVLAGTAVLGSVVGSVYLGAVRQLPGPATAWTLALLFLGVLGVTALRTGRTRAAVAAVALQFGALLLLHHGSIDLWQRRLDVGEARATAGREARAWNRARELHPAVSRLFPEHGRGPLVYAGDGAWTRAAAGTPYATLPVLAAGGELP